jgi:hypothetical protein
MKKVKLILLSTAVLLATIGAFATRSKKPAHKKQQLYRHIGDDYPGTFVPVGIYGSDYICQSSFDTCTYYLDGGIYYPNNLGTYISLH